jgi:hypothetical protein
MVYKHETRFMTCTANMRTDYENDSPEKIQNAKDRYSKYFQTDNVATDQFLSIEHDIHEQTAHNLTEYMLKIIQDKGYKGVTVGECLGDPAENWYRDSAGKLGTYPASGSTPTSSAAPSVTPTAVSTNGNCGGNTGFTCGGSEFGNCCSQAGWCGTTTDHCGTGCQNVFGVCGSSDKWSSSAAVASPTAASSAPAASASIQGKPSTDGSCGGTSGSNCLGWSEGECCSQYGWCGNTADHCGASCNPLFGKCGSSSPAASSAPAPAQSTVATSVRPTPSPTSAAPPAKTSAASNVSTNGRCGRFNGNKTCPGSQCCSAAGRCGSNLLYCWAGCQKGFGQCW